MVSCNIERSIPVLVTSGDHHFDLAFTRVRVACLAETQTRMPGQTVHSGNLSSSTALCYSSSASHQRCQHSPLYLDSGVPQSEFCLQDGPELALPLLRTVEHTFSCGFMGPTCAAAAAVWFDITWSLQWFMSIELVSTRCIAGIMRTRLTLAPNEQTAYIAQARSAGSQLCFSWVEVVTSRTKRIHRYKAGITG
jgi:hypothetical protein